MSYILITGISAAGTVSGLGTCFLGLSSLAGDLANDNPIQRVISLKQLLEEGSSLARDGDESFKSLYNLANASTRPPGTPPSGFQDGDEVPCKGTSIKSGNTVVAVSDCYITT